MTDTDFIKRLVAAARRYRNNLAYDPIPIFNYQYNSNGFVAGVIEAAGGTPPPLPVPTPGYDHPVPIP